MHFTKEQRESWERETRDSGFNRWLRDQCSRSDGSLDLTRLHAVARQYGVDPERYLHLNPGQQRINIGNRLRKLVPETDLGSHLSNFGQQVRVEVSTRSPAPPPAAPLRPQQDFASYGVRDLLQLHGRVLDELRARSVVRTGNAPLGDYAEWLFARAYGWRLEGNSSAGHDAADREGARFQIKARRLQTDGRGSRQLSVLRNLEAAGFDMLAAVLFAPDYSVWRAALIPFSIVRERSARVLHVNGWRFILEDAVWSLSGVVDATQALQRAEGG